MTNHNEPTHSDEQQRQLEQGAREAIRREVERREKEGLPIVVSEDGAVIDANRKGKNTKTS